MHVETWRSAYAHALPGDRLAAISISERARRWEQSLAAPRPRSAVYVAEIGDEVVGFASVGPSRDEDADDAVGELYAVYVHPDAWRRGAGRALLERATEVMRRAGFRQATLWVLDDNPRARRVYEAAGWGADGLEKEDTVLEDVRVTEVRYRLAL